MSKVTGKKHVKIFQLSHEWINHWLETEVENVANGDEILANAYFNWLLFDGIDACFVSHFRSAVGPHPTPPTWDYFSDMTFLCTVTESQYCKLLGLSEDDVVFHKMVDEFEPSRCVVKIMR
jgi:hypothetical protein